MDIQQVLKDVKPSLQEEKEVTKAAADFVRLLKPKFKDADIFLGGSIAKRTWLKGRYDFDIFIRFDYKKYQDKKDISDLLEKGLKGLKHERIHGSRDYFSVKHGKCTFEVVPVLKINSPAIAKNITDISPLHVLWVRKNMTAKMADEVRLLKAFCHAQNVYGAESYIRGFSGYACEILVVHAGSFLNVMKNASHWSGKEIIDVEKYYKRKNPLTELNKAKIESPLIMIDPVQASRNVTAALSEESFARLIAAAKQYIKKPAISFFIKKKITIESLHKNAKGAQLLIVKVEPVAGKGDVVAAKMLKAFEYAEKNLKSKFRIFGSGWNYDEGLFWFYADKKKLPEYEELAGPPLKEREGSARFKKKHRNTFVKRNRLYAKEKRPFRNSQDLLKALAIDQYIKTRVSNWRLVHA